MVKKLLFLMAFVLTTALPLLADEATVHNGTNTNDYVPVYGNWCDSKQQSQALYSADVLAEAGIVPGSTISGITYYCSSRPSIVWTSLWDVRLVETAVTSLTNYVDVTAATMVISGVTFDATSGTLAITFDTPYTYNGGNLVIDVRNQAAGNYRAATFYGENVSGGSVSHYSSNAVTARNFVPKTTFTFIPGAVSCERPESLTADNITDSSADIAWVGTASSYELVVNGDATIETGSSKALTGLNQNTLYSVQVRAICAEGDTSAYRSISFKTECGVITGTWTEGFENCATGSSSAPAPDCWALLNANDGTYPYIYVNTSSSYVKDGSKSLYFQSSSTRDGYAILPEIENPNTKLITFSYKSESASQSGSVEVGYITDITDANTYHAVSELYAPSTTWVDVEVALNTIPADSRIAIRYTKKSNNYYMGIDNIVVKKLPTCFKPSNLRVEDIQLNSAKLVWTPFAETNNVFNVTITDTNEEVIYDGVVNDTCLVIDGLTHSTGYKWNVSITTVCEDENADEFKREVKFRTLCDVIYGTPWTDDFESYDLGNSSSEAPGCWDILGANNGNYPYIYINNSSAYVKDGSQSLYFQSSKDSACFAILPAFSKAYTKQLRFSYRSESATQSGSVEVGYLTDITNPQSWHPLSEVFAPTTTWTEVEVPLDGIVRADRAKARVAIRYNNGPTQNYYMGIDNVVIEAIPSCYKPEAATIDNVGTNNIDLVWGASAKATEKQYHLVVVNAGDTIVDAITDTTYYSVTGLLPATQYNLNVEVASICNAGDTSSVEVSALSAMTECAQKVAPWSEDFNTLTYAQGIPTCWDNNFGDVTSAQRFTYYATGKEGIGLRFNSYTAQNNKWNELHTPATILPEDDGVSVSFDWKNPTGGEFSVLVSVDGQDFEILKEGLTGQETWKTETLSLAEYKGHEVVVAFKAISNYGNGDAYVYLDNVAFNAPSQFDILFVVNGDTVQAETAEYLAEVTYNGAAPTREATAQYTYTFKGWSEMIAPVTGHKTYVAEFDSIVNQYEVVFKKWSGETLQSEMLDYGTTPAFHGAEPFCEPTLAKVYTFVGWTPEIVEVTENVVYTAVLDSVDRKFKIDFVNEDGTLLKSDSVVYANKPVYTGATPVKASDAAFNYVFSGWDPVIISVYGDATYTAQFAPVARKYAVTWKNADGSTLRVDSVAYGKVPAYKGTPAKAATAQYSYTFSGWTPAVDTVKADVVYTAQYDQVVNKYMVKVYAASGTVTIDGEGESFMASKLVDYGTEVTIVATALEGYEFLNWTDDNTENPRKVVVNEDVEFTAWFGIVPTHTGIDNINAEDGAVKFIKDGILYIKRGDKIYDATGKMVE